MAKFELCCHYRTNRFFMELRRKLTSKNCDPLDLFITNIFDYKLIE